MELQTTSIAARAVRPERVRRAAHAYAGHLVAGGVTPWPDFLAEPRDPGDAGDPTTGPAWHGEVPGAAQAELLRRLNRLSDRRRGTGAPASTPELGARVLRRAAPGRGIVDLRLTDPPVTVPVAELLRVAAGVLADLVTELDPTSEPVAVSEGPAQRRGRTPSYRLEGPPVTVAALRGRLVAAGLTPRGSRRWRLRPGRPDVVVVVALPLHRALFEVWSRRTQRGGTRSWAGLLAEWHHTRRLPSGADYSRLAATWAGRAGAGRVHVVTGRHLDEQVAAVLGHRPAPASAGRTPLAELPPVLVEVVRRTSEVLTFRVGPEEKQPRLERLVALLAEEVGPAGDRGAPRASQVQRAWLQRTGRRTARRLRSGGYVLHGSLAGLARVGGPNRAPAVRDRVLLRALLRAVLRAEAARAAAGAATDTTS